MNKRIFKYYPVWQVDTEEEWLNKKALEGWNMIATDGVNFDFTRGTPGEFTYRIDAQPEKSSNADWQDYLDMLNEAKVEHVARYREWTYLRKRKADGPFELFSDLDSRIAFWERIRNRYFVILIPFALFFVLFIINWNIRDITDSIPRTIVALFLAFYLWGIAKLMWTIDKLKKEREIHE